MIGAARPQYNAKYRSNFPNHQTRSGSYFDNIPDPHTEIGFGSKSYLHIYAKKSTLHLFICVEIEWRFLINKFI